MGKITKLGILTIVFLVILPSCLAAFNPKDDCFGTNAVGARDLFQVAACDAEFAMGGTDIALAILLIIIVFSMFKWGAPLSVVVPVVLIYCAVWIGAKIMTMEFSTLFYFALFIVGVLLAIGIVKFLRR